jgi:hypothetical protein
MLYLKLFLLGGLTWIFEVLSFRFGKFDNNNWFWLVCSFIFPTKRVLKDTLIRLQGINRYRQLFTRRFNILGIDCVAQTYPTRISRPKSLLLHTSKWLEGNQR